MTRSLRPDYVLKKFLIERLDQQPDQTRKHAGKSGQHERGPPGRTDFEFRSRNVIVNMAALVKFHQNKRDDKTNRRPLEATQSKIEHPAQILSREIGGVQLLATLHAEFPAIAIWIVKPEPHVF